MINLRDNETGVVIGAISEEDLAFLEESLEEESGEDQDYWIDLDTVEMLEEAGAPASLLALLRHALTDRAGVEIAWGTE
ncbi:MAG TPA: hypothetical protein VM764_01030 [Gemmatimonadaceae bacterium]|jgi:hypothetical protein|nr:hypothetical protein [Gemmatimonadaceae bacterium]